MIGDGSLSISRPLAVVPRLRRLLTIILGYPAHDKLRRFDGLSSACIARYELPLAMPLVRAGGRSAEALWKAITRVEARLPEGCVVLLATTISEWSRSCCLSGEGRFVIKASSCQAKRRCRREKTGGLSSVVSTAVDI